MSKKKKKSRRAEMPKSRMSGESEPIVSLLRPRKTEALVKIAKEFMDGKKPNLNHGIYSEKELEKMVVKPYMYMPTLIQIGRKLKCIFAIRGQKSRNNKAPSGWNENILGAHEPGMKLDKFRLSHADDVRKMVSNKNDLMTIGSYEYIVGSEKPSIFCINSARSGSYEANIEVAKEIGFDGIKEINNLVGQINNKVEVEKFEDGIEMVWLPNMAVTWGYMEQDDKQLICSQIRKLDKMSGTKFIPLKEPIISNGISESAWWAGVKKFMSAASTKNEDGKTALDRFEARESRSTKEEQREARVRGWENLSKTQVRCHPGQYFCHSFRNVQSQIPGFTCFSEDGKTETVKFAAGMRLPIGLSENKHVLKKRIKDADDVDAETKPKVEKKPKKVKAEKKKVVAKKKTKKRKSKQITTVEKLPVTEEFIEEPVSAAPAPEFSDDYDEDQELVEVDTAQREQAEQDMMLNGDDIEQ